MPDLFCGVFKICAQGVFMSRLQQDDFRKFHRIVPDGGGAFVSEPLGTDGSIELLHLRCGFAERPADEILPQLLHILRGVPAETCQHPELHGGIIPDFRGAAFAVAVAAVCVFGGHALRVSVHFRKILCAHFRKRAGEAQTEPVIVVDFNIL